jgi:23S rRNA (guanosine2251-2'-O)-methyltransferase
MSGQGKKTGSGSWSKSGRPRPGTGGYGRRRLEGKGPTPPAEMRPGHPAQRRAAGATSTARGKPRTRATASGEESGQQIAGRQGYGSEGRARGAGRSASSNRGAGGAVEVVAGRNAVLESLRAAVPAIALHVGPRLDADERISEAIKLAADAGIAVVEAGRSELDRLTGGAVHQGLALRIRPYAYAHPDDLLSGGGQPPLIVALDGITDPRNLGAIARSVAAFSATGVLIPGRRSAGVTAGAWKASAGALARDADDDIDGMTLADGPLVLVIGSEGRGMSRLVAQQCDLTVRIPISGAESLNAGVAAGIALYAVSRQRGDGERGNGQL